MRITCPNCGCSVDAGIYCDLCGTKLRQKCQTCGAENRFEARFCAKCGVIVDRPFVNFDVGSLFDANAAQQKSVTILFADICGSTRRIAGMDPEAARDALTPIVGVISDALARHGGLVTHRMGDGVMALFGAPRATEDHAARACFAILSAFENVRRMGQLAMPIRAGLCSGPIILCRTGRDDEDYGVSGVTVHIASRLEQLAEPDTILLVPQTLSLVTGIVRAEPVGDKVLKGFSEPLPVYRLLSAVDRPSWKVRSGSRALSPFVGRDRELRQLSLALDRVASGRPQAIAVVGDGGMGKSRLVHEFLRPILKGKWRVVRIETTAQTMAIPHFLVTELLQELLGCSEGDASPQSAAHLLSAIVSLGFDAQFDATPLLVHFNIDRDALGRESLEPADRRRRLYQSLHPILMRYAELHPLVLVIEDCQWLDASSYELLSDLIEGLDSVPLLLLMTTRPERRPGWPGLAQAETDNPRGYRFEVELEGLSADQADQLLQELIGGSSQLAPLRAHIVSHADGTPLFLEEFTRSLCESGKISGGFPRPADIVMPNSVQAILAARIDRQLPLAQRILQIAAVIGHEVPLSLLKQVSDVDATILTKAIGELRTAKFLVENGFPRETVYTFSHALTRAVAYETLLRSDRHALHERVLRVLEARGSEYRDSVIDQLAHHAVSAEAWPEAARYAFVAGERASRRAALTEAKAYLETAIAALDHQPVSITTLTLGIDARLALRGVGMNEGSGNQESLLKYLTEADHLAEVAGDRLSMARVTISRGAILSHWGDLPTATEVSQTALSVTISIGDVIGIVGAAFALAQAHWYSGNLRVARDLLIDHLHYARAETGQQRGGATFVLPAAAFFCYLGRIHAELGDIESGFDALREARAIALRYGHAFDQTLVNMNEGWLLRLSGQLEKSIEVLERARSVVNANNFEWHVPMIAYALGGAYLDAGRPHEARQLLENGVAIADRNRHVGKRLLCAPHLIRALAESSDQPREAGSNLAFDTLREATARGFRPIIVQTNIAIGRMMIQAGELGRARAALEKSLVLARQLGLTNEAGEATALLSQATVRRTSLSEISSV
jgi:class 3 adenylate cyclase/tetratricopeptide (TPR) repeat protein